MRTRIYFTILIGIMSACAFAEDAPAPATPKEANTRAKLYPPTTGPAPELASPKQSVEWSMDVGCQHCHFSEDTGIKTCVQNCGPAGRYNGKVYFLRGNTSKEFGKGGIWLVKGALSQDGKTVVVDDMKMTAAAADDKDAPPVAAPPAESLKDWTGVVFHTGKFLPSMTVGTQRFGLKPSKSALAEVRATLTRIGGGEVTGNFTVSGTTYKDDSRDWIVVETIKPAP